MQPSLSARPWRRACGLAAVAALWASCSDEQPGAVAPVDPSVAVGFKPGQINTFTDIDTALSATKVKAGVEVHVTCTAMPGGVVVPKPTFVVAPADGVKIAGDAITVERAGTYTVACVLNNSKKLADATPASLAVVAGPAKTILTAVSPAKIAAGGTFTVSCSGKDAFGNPVGKDGEAFGADVAPPTLATLDDKLTGTGNKAGKGDVRCKIADQAADAQVTPAALEVVPGAPVKTQAVVTPGEIVAGDGGAEVTCTAEDAHGNAVKGAFTLDVPPAITITATKVGSTKAGTYEIKCVLPEVADKQAATLVVKPAAPIAWAIGLQPAAKIYRVDDTVKVMSLEQDPYGNVAKVHLETGVAVDPPAAVTVNAGGKSFSFGKDGYVTFSYNHPTLKTKSGSSKDSIKVKVDSNGPLVYFATPKRGETRDGNPDVKVQGTAIDELSAIKSFTINGKSVKVSGDGSFSFTISSTQGMNAIIWEALDEWDNKSNGVQTWYYSTKWHPNDTTKPIDARVPTGIGMWLSQKTIDAGPPHNHKTPKDLASVVEIVLGTLDLKSMLGAAGMPFAQTIDLGLFKMELAGSMQIVSLKMGDKGINEGYPEVGLTVINGGMHLKAKIHQLDATIKLNITKPLAGWQEFIIHSDWITIETDVMVSLDPKTKKTAASLKNTKIKIQAFDVKLGQNNLPGILGQLVSGGVNLLLGVIKQWVGGPLTGLIEQILADQVQKLLGDQLGKAFESLAINTELPLKPFIGKGDEVKLKLNSGLGQLLFKAGEGVLVGLDASMTAPHKVPYAVLGSIGRAACLKPGAKDVFNPALKYAIEIGLADDFVNELLHAVWNGGLLQMNIGAESLGSVDLGSFGVKDLSVATDFMLQPMVTSCLSADGTLKLQVGDLGVHAKLAMGDTPIDVWMYAALQATAELKAVDNPKTKQKEIGFSLKGVDFLELEITQINAEAKNMKELFATLIKTVLIPKLLDGLGSGLGGFPLPELDLSALSPAIPPGTKLAIEVQAIHNDGGYTYLRGKVK